mmetsp:Transcript_39175/g.59774  ORF Transcript_39175/g.59774 Transcript_39175/m.59774 type:complete len:80 (-) Transcript_39175:95-334(-)
MVPPEGTQQVLVTKIKDPPSSLQPFKDVLPIGQLPPPGEHHGVNLEQAYSTQVSANFKPMTTSHKLKSKDFLTYRSLTY